MPFSTKSATPVIETPSGNYTPKSDDLKKELDSAALKLGFVEYTVFIDGHEVKDASALQTNSIAAVNATIRIAPYVVPAVR